MPETRDRKPAPKAAGGGGASPTVPYPTECPTVSPSPSLPLCLSHCVSLIASPTVSPSPSFLLCLSHCASHRLSHCVSLAASPTVSPTVFTPALSPAVPPSLPLALACAHTGGGGGGGGGALPPIDMRKLKKAVIPILVTAPGQVRSQSMDTNCTAPSLIPTVTGNTVRSFPTHGQLSAAAQGSSANVSRSDIRSIQHFDSSAHGLVRRWLFIGYFPSSRCHRRGYLSRCRRKLTAPFFFCTHPGAAADGVQQVPRPLHALHQDQGALPGAASAPPRAHPPVAPPRRRCVPKPLLNFN
jgi:hypothetical protein